MERYQVVESQVWQRDDGAKASIYGACPWTSAADKPRWQIVRNGYTIRDNRLGTVGIGRPPFKTHAEAQGWIDAREGNHAAHVVAYEAYWQRAEDFTTLFVLRHGHTGTL